MKHDDAASEPANERIAAVLSRGTSHVKSALGEFQHPYALVAAAAEDSRGPLHLSYAARSWSFESFYVGCYDDCLVFKPSPIHGMGGFAIQPIPKGARVIEYTGQKISKSESLERCLQGNHFIFYLDAGHDLDGNVPWNSARLLNHSCSPNCDAELVEGRVWILANRDIAAGEEITFNYNFDLIDYKDHPCHCGSSNCVGYIVAEEFFAHLKPT